MFCKIPSYTGNYHSSSLMFHISTVKDVDPAFFFSQFRCTWPKVGACEHLRVHGDWKLVPLEHLDHGWLLIREIPASIIEFQCEDFRFSGLKVMGLLGFYCEHQRLLGHTTACFPAYQNNHQAICQNLRGLWLR